MIAIRQATAWSCVPTAFAMAAGVDLNDLISQIGHDGSEIVFPHLPEPLCRRAFHPQECVLALLRMESHKTFITISKILNCIASDEDYFNIETQEDVFDALLSRYDGVIIGEIHGKMHAAAWDHKKQLALDPNGFFYPKQKYTIEHFYALASI